MKKIIGLIPSRLGSKRLPGKALADIANMPVIIHVAKRALLSNLLDRVVVCTDSQLIAQKGNEYNVESVITDSTLYFKLYSPVFWSMTGVFFILLMILCINCSTSLGGMLPTSTLKILFSGALIIL